MMISCNVVVVAAVIALALDAGATVNVNADGSYSYDPTGAAALQALNDTESANDTFTYTISDGNGGSDTATVTITVDGVTDAGPPPDVTSDLVTHWTFNEGAGSTAADTGAAGSTSDTGTLAGDGGWSTAGLGGALDLSAGGYVDVADSTDLNLASTTTDYSVSLWFYADSTAGRQVLYEQGGGSQGLSIYIEDATVYVGGWNPIQTGWAGTFLSTSVTAGQWHHIALTLSGGGSVAADALIGYLNGVEFDRGNGSQLGAHAGDIGIGRIDGVTRTHTGNQNSGAYGGRIDDIRVYRRALQANDIAQLASSNPVDPGGGSNTDPVANDGLNDASGAALPYSEDFTDGIADGVAVASGTWIGSSGRYAALGGDTVALLNTQDPLPPAVNFGALVKVDNFDSNYCFNAVLIFDYVSATDFKFVDAFIGDDVRIGTRDAGGWNYDLITDVGTLNPLTDYRLDVTIDDSGAVTLLLNGSAVASHNFASDTTDGQLGLGTDNAQARFDNFTVDGASGSLAASLEDSRATIILSSEPNTPGSWAVHSVLLAWCSLGDKQFSRHFDAISAVAAVANRLE